MLCRDFTSGVLKQEDLFQADETRFKIDSNNSYTLAMRGDMNIHFADSVSRDEGMKMMLMLGGGEYNQMGISLLIFKKISSSYEICRLRKNFSGVTYRTGPKG